MVQRYICSAFDYDEAVSGSNPAPSQPTANRQSLGGFLLEMSQYRRLASEGRQRSKKGTQI